MKRLYCHLLFSLVLGVAAAHGGDIVDRIVANVNGHAILQSDWQQEVAFEAFLDARPVDSFTAEERKAALDRLIDQELLREQVHPSEAAPAEAVAAQVTEVRKLHPEATSDDGWGAVLSRYGLTPRVVAERLGQHIELMRLVEDHLRPSIQIDARAVESYYQEQLVPELQKKGDPVATLPEVSARIRDLLAEQKMNELIAGWLQNLRSESRISTASEGEENP